MVASRVALAVILAVAVAACATSPSPSAPQAALPSGSPQLTNFPDGPSPVVPTARANTPSPAPTAKTPKSTPLPVPPKPTGLKLAEEQAAECDENPMEMCAIGDSTFTLSWKAPRTKGVQVRVYGVTKCFGRDGDGRAIDGHCLRERTALPGSVRVLLAKAPASKGTVTWSLGPGWEGPDGVTVHSIVIAAYNATGGHSIFAIADAGFDCC